MRASTIAKSSASAWASAGRLLASPTVSGAVCHWRLPFQWCASGGKMAVDTFSITPPRSASLRSRKDNRCAASPLVDTKALAARRPNEFVRTRSGPDTAVDSSYPSRRLADRTSERSRRTCTRESCNQSFRHGHASRRRHGACENRRAALLERNRSTLRRPKGRPRPTGAQSLSDRRATTLDGSRVSVEGAKRRWRRSLVLC